jgi:hypothetical protein
MASYNLSSRDAVLVHGQSVIWQLKDINEKHTPPEIDALVASGDLFVTLATRLDEVANSLQASSPPYVQGQLEDITTTLLYLQQHYNVSPTPSDRQ